jgi:hypothetical protein
MVLLWFMLSGYSRPHTWLSTHGMWWLSPEGILVVSHQEQRAYNVFPVLVSF